MPLKGKILREKNLFSKIPVVLFHDGNFLCMREIAL